MTDMDAKVGCEMHVGGKDNRVQDVLIMKRFEEYVIEFVEVLNFYGNI